MLEILADFLKGAAAVGVLSRVQRQWTDIQESLRLFALAALLLEISLPFFVISLGLLLTSLFFHLLPNAYLVKPFLETGLVSLALGLFLVLISNLVSRKK